LYLGAGSHTITQSKITGNHVRGGDIATDSSDFPDYGYGGDARGGGISSRSGALTPTLSTVSGNSGLGGEALKTQKRSVGGNAVGGGLALESAGAQTSLKQSTISGNMVVGGIGNSFGDYFSGYAFGGGGYFHGGTSTVEQLTINGNSVIGGVPGPAGAT